MHPQSTTEPGLLESLSWIDLTAIGILVVVFVLGRLKGLIWQLRTIATLLIAYVLAGIYGEALGDRIRGWFSADVPRELPLYIAYFLVFLGVLIVISLIAYFLDKLIKHSGLSGFNRLGGGVLGIATGACVVIALLAAIFMFFGRNADIVVAAESSRSVQVSRDVLRTLGDWVPEPVRDVFGLQPTPLEADPGEPRILEPRDPRDVRTPPVVPPQDPERRR